MSTDRAPRLWSDFDGTAVELVPKWNWRNWTKYPLAAIAGYADFLSGVRDSGVEVLGVVSRRPNISARQAATARSMANLGLNQHYSWRHGAILAGSEEAKTMFVVEDARRENVPVGLIDDKPHKCGKALIGSLLRVDRGGMERDPTNQLVLGVVDTPHRDEYLEQLHGFAEGLSRRQDRLSVSEIETGGVSRLEIVGASQESGYGQPFTLTIVGVDQYSHEAGQSFGSLLVSTQQ